MSKYKSLRNGPLYQTKIILEFVLLWVFIFDFGTTAPFTAQEKIDILQYHNDARAAVNPPAINMQTMVWNTTLEGWAQAWVNGCQNTDSNINILDHSPSSSRPGAGENIYASSGTATTQGAVNSWDSEKSDYVYSTNYCRGQLYTATSQVWGYCGHYTQIAWATSKQLGCARGNCPNIPYPDTIVCNYAPAGNVYTLPSYEFNRPYQTPASGSSPSATPTRTPSVSPSQIPSVTPSVTPTPTRTPSVTPSRTPTPSVTPSVTPSRTPSTSPGVSTSSTPSTTPSPTRTPSVTPSRTPTPSVTPSVTPSRTPSTSPGASTSSTPSPSPSTSSSSSLSSSPGSPPSSSPSQGFTPSASSSSGAVGPSQSPSKSPEGKKGGKQKDNNMVIIAAAAGGGALVVIGGAAAAFILIRKKKNAYKPSYYNNSSAIADSPSSTSTDVQLKPIPVLATSNIQRNLMSQPGEISSTGTSPKPPVPFHPVSKPPPVTSNSKPPIPGNNNPFPVGSQCVAKYTGDGQFYKAVVLQFNPSKGYLISYPEYGEQEWLPLSSLKK